MLTTDPDELGIGVPLLDPRHQRRRVEIAGGFPGKKSIESMIHKSLLVLIAIGTSYTGGHCELLVTNLRRFNERTAGLRGSLFLLWEISDEV